MFWWSTFKGSAAHMKNLAQNLNNSDEENSNFFQKLLIKFVSILQRKWIGQESEKTIPESAETDASEKRQEKVSVQKWRHTSLLWKVARSSENMCNEISSPIITWKTYKCKWKLITFNLRNVQVKEGSMILCLQIKSLVNNKRDDGEKGRDYSKLCNVIYRRSHTYLDFGRAKGSLDTSN